MKPLIELERLGYEFVLAIDYAGPNAPPPEAAQLLNELASK
jgi:hypothetical protein